LCFILLFYFLLHFYYFSKQKQHHTNYIKSTLTSLQGRKRAFCLVRPPGHHVGRHGRTDGCCSHGFCLLNNVAIGVSHARVKWGLQRVAIVDFDVHFGNGTCEIFENDHDVFFSSVHLASRSNFPFFASDLSNATLIDQSNCCVAITRRSGEFRKTFRDIVLPKLKAFDPELVLVSAGFDGHRDDPLGGDLGLHEDDYTWLTSQITSVCDDPSSSCHGRICR
jgi:acetoin utilization deacetylase AcuC-like enzyme